MIPLGDSEAPRRLSRANTVLIIGNVAVFVLELRGSLFRVALQRFAMIPWRISHIFWYGAGSAAGTLTTLVTAQFLHAGVVHLAGNLLYLFVFGPAVESRMGGWRFLLFYLAAGAVAGLAIVAMAPESLVPVIGASGSIAGVLGGYFVVYPGGRVKTIMPARWRLRLGEVRAIFYLLLWFAWQLYAGLQVGPHGIFGGGVAWWAHVGGFLFGVAAAPLIAQKPAQRGRVRRSAASPLPRR